MCLAQGKPLSDTIFITHVRLLRKGSYANVHIPFAYSKTGNKTDISGSMHGLYVNKTCLC